jgi:hypothetical protein
MAFKSFFAELRKRKVLQAAAIYGAIAWGVTEVVVTVVEQLYLPPWISTLATIFFVVGFPVAMFLAWTFDRYPEDLGHQPPGNGKHRRFNGVAYSRHDGAVFSDQAQPAGAGSEPSIRAAGGTGQSCRPAVCQRQRKSGRYLSCRGVER